MPNINYNAALPTLPLASQQALDISEWLNNLNTPTFDQQIQKLFANGEQGFFYDPNDLTTLYQDAAGTIPVTGAGQPVGLILDKSKRLELGGEIVTNSWTPNAVTITYSGNSLTFLNANQSADLANNTGSIVAGKWYKGSFTVSDFVAGGVSFSVGATSQGTASDLANGAYSFIFQATATGILQLRARFSATTLKVSNITLKELLGNHAYQTTSASRPILRKNAVTGANYLEFDGSDDFLQTNNIDFTATDKVSLFAGVRKLSDASTAIVAELSTNSDRGNAFALLAPGLSGSGKFLFRSGGSVIDNIGGAFTTSSAYSAPYTSILTGNGHIGSDTTALRINSQTVAVSNTDQGTGNYGNHPLYIGRRAGANLPFKGHIYGLIGIGKLTSDSETATIEKELAKRLGVTL